MRRRAFIVLLSGAAAWPFAASAQQSVPVIGVLHSASAGAFAPLLVTLREGLSEAGYIDGQNVRIEYRFAEGQYDRLPAMAAELVSQQISLIVAGGGDRPALAAKAATTTIPIVFTGSDDPVKFGLVASLHHPGANVTGVSVFQSKLEAKKFALLRDLVPTIPRMAMLVNPNGPTAETDVQEVQEAARAVGQQIDFHRAKTERDRCGVPDYGPAAHECPSGGSRPIPVCPTRTASGLDGIPCDSGDLRGSRVRLGRRPDELRQQSRG